MSAQIQRPYYGDRNVWNVLQASNKNTLEIKSETTKYL